jgi:hypothetical protein
MIAPNAILLQLTLCCVVLCYVGRTKRADEQAGPGTAACDVYSTYSSLKTR